MLQCPKCQHQNLEEAQFCSSCGFDLTETNQHTQIHSIADLAPERAASNEAVFKGSGPRLVIVQGAKTGSIFSLAESSVTLGRHPTSDVFLDDVTVSRRHAEIHQTDDGYEVQDMGSLNGTYVNKERIESMVLNPGDEVQVGKFKFLFLDAVN